MKRLWMLALVCACCLVAVKSGQTQTAQPVGPVRLDGDIGTPRPVGPIYTLRRLQVSGTKPAEEVWFLQEQGVATANGSVEPNETAFRSLASPVLRDYVSHLPAGTRIVHSPAMFPGPDPTERIGDDGDPNLQDFAKFCRSKKINFVSGIPF